MWRSEGAVDVLAVGEVRFPNVCVIVHRVDVVNVCVEGFGDGIVGEWRYFSVPARVQYIPRRWLARDVSADCAGGMVVSEWW